LLGSVVDASERRAVERERDALLAQLRALNEELASHVGVLEATLRERDGLLREVQHRVKNNLQLVSSLMNMQVRRSLEPPIRQVLEECQRRVQAIALIHEILHQSGDYTRVPFADYARGLANNLFQGAGGGRGAVRLELAIDSVVLAVDQAIPCGLILNELIANALEHGFPGGRGGTIRVVIARRDVQQVGVAVMDDGVGVPPEVSIEEARTLGFQLVRTLARQLKAEVTLDLAQGTCVRLQFGTEGRT
jgi:two-component sensor histidine kinase